MQGVKSTVYPQNVSTEIEGALLSFSSITKVPVTYYDMSGQVMCEYRSQDKICKFLHTYNLEGSLCRHNLLSSITIASQLGEPYIFLCCAGLVNIAITIFHEGLPYGCLIAGPIVMEKLNQRIFSKIISLNTKTIQGAEEALMSGITESLARIMLMLKDMKIYTAKDISSLSTLLNNSLLANVLNYEDYKNANLQYKEQVKLGSYLQASKKANKQPLYPSQLESLLIQYIKTGNRTQAPAVMQQYLDAIIMYESGNVESIKIHLIELCALVSRACNNNAQSVETAVNDSFTHINSLNNVQQIQDLAGWSQGMVDYFTTKKVKIDYEGSSQIIKDVLIYMSEDTTLRVTLADVAKALHLNASYLSTHFKKEMQLSFTDYLVKTRIEKAKHLLSETDLRLADIAQNCGFDDQSYFTKVFKKESGQAPKQFRSAQRNL